jgi:membrane protein implicated in regulation of membrane protease activity
MLKLFQVCFYTGVLYTVISFILGHLLDFAGVGGDIDVDIDVDVDIDIDVDGGIDSHTDIAGVHVSPFKPITIAAFVTVFGGVGMIFLKNNYNALVALAAAAVFGFATSYLLYRFLLVPLYRAQNTSAVSQAELVGSLAYTALSMKDESFGKIRYTVEGNTYSAPAKSVDGRVIAKGVPVVIINIKKNIFYVKEVKGGSM